MITTDDPALAKACRALRNHGLDPDSAVPDFIMPGFNLRLTEFQAAFGLVQMGKLSSVIESRRCQANVYDEFLGGSPLTRPKALPGSIHVYQSYVVLLPTAVASRRPDIISRLRARGVETTIGTYHMPLTTYFRRNMEYSIGAFPATDDISARALSLPLFVGLTAEQQRCVVAELLDVIC